MLFSISERRGELFLGPELATHQVIPILAEHLESENRRFDPASVERTGTKVSFVGKPFRPVRWCYDPIRLVSWGEVEIGENAFGPCLIYRLNFGQHLRVITLMFLCVFALPLAEPIYSSAPSGFSTLTLLLILLFVWSFAYSVLFSMEREFVSFLRNAITAVIKS